MACCPRAGLTAWLTACLMTLRMFIPARCLALAAWLQRHPMPGFWALKPLMQTQPTLTLSMPMPMPMMPGKA